MPQRFQVSVAASILRCGGIIAYPTEAVFGLGCDPHNLQAVTRLLELKGRSSQAGFILVAAETRQIEHYVDDPGGKLLAKASASWPGPVTWILPARNLHPLITGGRDTVAIRVTAHPLCQQLCGLYGDVIVSTSANISGQKPARNALQVRRRFGPALDGLLNGALGDALQPTQIIDAVSGQVIRQA